MLKTFVILGQMIKSTILFQVKNVLQIANENNTHQVQSIISGNDMLPVHQIREDQMALSTLKSEKVDTPVASALDNTHGCFPSHILYNPPEEPDMAPCFQNTQNSDTGTSTTDT